MVPSPWYDKNMRIVYFLIAHILQVPFYVAAAVLLGTAFLQFLRRHTLKTHASRIFLYSAGFVFAYLIYVSYLQFRAFYEGGVMAPILGTGSGLLWFWNYVQTRFWNDYLISLPAALVFAFVSYYFNKKYEERFFEKEELWLAALGILLVGYPGFLFYLILVLLLPALVSALFVRRGERLPLYHFWIPTAIVVLLAVQFWAKHQSWWGAFRF